MDSQQKENLEIINAPKQACYVEMTGRNVGNAFNMFSDDLHKGSSKGTCGIETSWEGFWSMDWTEDEADSCMREVQLSPQYPKLLHAYLLLAKVRG
eukprot:2213929-Pyramimonas_sp.AAC.1